MICPAKFLIYYICSMRQSLQGALGHVLGQPIICQSTGLYVTCALYFLYRPVAYLPAGDTPTIAVRFSPVIYQLHSNTSE